MANKLQNDEECINEWRRLLTIFHSIEKERPKDMKQKLDALIAEATNNHLLTYRQVDGIVSRAKNLQNVEYGNTKKPEHYSHTKTS